jgi:glycosyltransferase involved in cell wall biosynthesis
MQKLISFCVPSYNSEAYMEKCINSLLIGGDKVEIIIVNDGSKDNTGAIADSYKEKYPNIVKVIHKENGGHGSGVNAGVREATGIYYKVVDSDDWADEEGLLKLLETIEKHKEEDNLPDMYFVNYLFENVSDNTTFLQDFRRQFPVDKFFTWKDIKPFKVTEYLMMHALVYKLSVIKESGMVLPEKTFYVDNLFTFTPMYWVKKMYYLDITFYHYFIGRQDQSVNINNMVKRYDQQLRVMLCMSTAFTMDELNKLDKPHRKYMLHDLEAKSFLTIFYVMADYNKQKIADYKEYFKAFKAHDKKLYRKIRFGTLFFFPFLLPRPLRKAAALFGYKQVCKKTRWG